MFESIRVRKKSIEAGAKIRRLLDLSAVIGDIAKDHRADDRYKRTLPVLVTPWRGRQTSNSDSHIGITRDISDHGIRAFFFKAPTDEEFLLSLVLQREGSVLECFHFLSVVRNKFKFAPDIYTVGLNVLEHLPELDVDPGIRSLTRLIGQDSEGVG